MKVAVIGGGAAGFFAALSCRQHHPNAEVVILEGSGKLLSKVKVSGGGRCNVTHACFHNNKLVKFYPRGGKFLGKCFEIFSTKDTVDWFVARGVKLKTEEDGRMFPASNDSQTIIDCFMREAEKARVEIVRNAKIRKIEIDLDGFRICGDHKVFKADKVIVAAGGSSNKSGFEYLESTKHTIVDPVPSLFTFNMPEEDIISLPGVVAEKVKVKIKGSDLNSEGPLLITHWGMSGPAILKLSSHAARHLSKRNYLFEVLVNWIDGRSETEARDILSELVNLNGKRKAGNKNPFGLVQRLWNFLLEKSEIDPEKIWAEQKKKNINRLINALVNDCYQVKGKTTFKEEFVTCGGIDLTEVDPASMESKLVPGLYFAGEVLDIDAVTGGFNFQAAWTTGFIAGQLRH